MKRFRYGYGAIISRPSDVQLKEFIKKHRNVVVALDEGEDILNACDEPQPLCDIFPAWGDETTYTGIECLIAVIMKEETDIGFDCNEEGPIGIPIGIFLPAKFPWECTMAEKSLTLETLDDILHEYLDELGLDSSCIGPGNY